MMPFLFIGATAMRVGGNKEGNGTGNKGVRRGTATATKRATATTIRVADKNESKGNKGDGNDNKVVGNEEGNNKVGKSDGDGD